MAETGSSEQGQQSTRRKKFLEILSTFLLVLATMASSWSAYQATRWNGAQSVGFSESGVLHAEAARRTSVETQLVGIDVGLFVQYAAALNRGDTKLADFVFHRFGPELKSATEAWLKTRPLNNPDAPSSPFEMKEYSVEDTKGLQELIDKSEERFEGAKKAKENAEDYIFLAILFEMVLFFSSMGMKFGSDYAKGAILSLSAVIYVAGLVILSSFPVY